MRGYFFVILDRIKFAFESRIEGLSRPEKAPRYGHDC